MNEKLNKLIDARAKNFEAMKRLNDLVLSEDRAYTAVEKEQNERMEAEFQDIENNIENLEKLAKREAILSEGVRKPLFAGKSDDKITKDDVIKADYEARVFPMLMTRGFERLSDADKGVVAQ